MLEFYAYVRGQSDHIPAGYSENGMRLYRRLVYIGVEQMLHNEHPTLKDSLGNEQWEVLLLAFIRESQWDSHFYGDLCNEFIQFLHRKTA